MHMVVSRGLLSEGHMSHIDNSECDLWHGAGGEVRSSSKSQVLGWERQGIKYGGEPLANCQAMALLSGPRV